MLGHAVKNDYNLQGRTWNRETLKIKSYLQEIYGLLQFALMEIWYFTWQNSYGCL